MCHLVDLLSLQQAIIMNSSIYIDATWDGENDRRERTDEDGW
jgi:hypothetical protein